MVPKNAVKVAIRTRPTSNFAQDQLRIDSGSGSIAIDLRKRGDAEILNNVQDKFSFRFDKLLHNASQETVYDEVGVDVAKSVLQGYNGTIMAYGQTGAGKTFTMTGGMSNFKYRGVIPRAVNQIFNEINSRPEQAVVVRVSYLEIYNEQLYDLLNPVSLEPTGFGGAPTVSSGLAIAEDGKSVYVKGMTMPIATTEEEALEYMFEGETNRAIGEHQMNMNSSRSHCVFTLHVEMRSRVESGDRTLRSKLNLVDLAGSERVSKTKSVGTVLKEATYINKSLSFLEQVVIALSTPGRDHIPYRQTKLTNVLKDSLGGNCKTYLIANIWAEPQFLDETVSTLKFATRMMRVQNEPVLNVEMDPATLVKRYEREIRDLKQELAMLNQLNNRSQVSYEGYSEEQRYELGKKVRTFLNADESSGNVPEIEVDSLRAVKEVFLQFRNVVRQMEAEIEEKLRRKYELVEKKESGGEGVSKEGEDKTTEDDVSGVGDLDHAPSGAGVAAPASQFKKRTRAKKTVSSSKDVNVEGTGEEEEFDEMEEEDEGRPSRSEAFEEFKSSEVGVEILQDLREAQGQLAEKKRSISEIANQVNVAKKEIDKMNQHLGTKTMEQRQADDGEKTEIIDEEEFIVLRQLKEEKQKYREAFKLLKEVRGEKEYLVKMVRQCRQRLVADFENMYESTYGPVKEASSTQKGEAEDVVDVKDDAEKFDEMEMQRVMEEDPESVAFYKARKIKKPHQVLSSVSQQKRRR